MDLNLRSGFQCKEVKKDPFDLIISLMLWLQGQVMGQICLPLKVVLPRSHLG